MVTPPPTLDTRAELRQYLRWLPQPLFNRYYAEWVRTQDSQLAWDFMREGDQYEVYFGGNKREDGTIRWDEQRYLSIIDDYAQTLRLAGLNPDRFRHRFGDLVASDKSPEEFAAQVETLVSRVMLDAPEVLEQYAAQWGIEMTQAGLIGAALDPDLSQQILEKRITMAEIAAEGSQMGFEIDHRFARKLSNVIDQAEADEFFGQAAQWIPALGALARRHADPEDDFDINTFAAAEIFDDPAQRLRMRRLVNQERASFTTTGGFGVKAAQETGGLTGLGNR